MEEQDEELVEELTVARVAKLFSVNRDTVRRWLREGRLKGVDLGGRAGYDEPRGAAPVPAALGGRGGR